MAHIVPAAFLNDVLDALKQGAVAALPTETVYGLAGRVGSERALRQIFAVKNRPFFDPLIVHIANDMQLNAATAPPPAPVAQAYRVLQQTFWPGPLTLIYPKSPHLSDLVTAGLQSVAVRSPSHPLFRQILLELDEPLAAPSANKFGCTSPTQAAHVAQEFPADSFFILDGGPSDVGLESTITEIVEGSPLELRIYRPGQILASDILATLNAAGITCFSSTREIAAMAPGQLKHHYMPPVPLVLCPDGPDVVKQVSQSLPFTPARLTKLQLSTEPHLAARELYGRMRDLCAAQADALYFVIEPTHLTTAWTAHMDRLRKACCVDLTAL